MIWPFNRKKQSGVDKVREEAVASTSKAKSELNDKFAIMTKLMESTLRELESDGKLIEDKSKHEGLQNGD